MEWHKTPNKKVTLTKLLYIQLFSYWLPCCHQLNTAELWAVLCPKAPKRQRSTFFPFLPVYAAQPETTISERSTTQTPRRAAQEFPQNPKRGCKASGLFPKKEKCKKKELRKLQCRVRSSWINIQGWATCLAFIRGVALKNISRLTFLSVWIIFVIITTQV